MNSKLRERLYLEVTGAQVALQAGEIAKAKTQIERAIAILDSAGDYGYGYGDEDQGRKSWLDTLAQTFSGRR